MIKTLFVVPCLMLATTPALAVEPDAGTAPAMACAYKEARRLAADPALAANAATDTVVRTCTAALDAQLSAIPAGDPATPKLRGQMLLRMRELTAAVFARAPG